MKTYSNRDFIYIGKEAGTEILNKIKNAKSSVKIVSPYLSSSYIQELIKLHKQGREVVLITCDNLVSERSPYSDFNISDLVNKEKVLNPKAEKSRKAILKAFIIIFGVFLLTLLPNLLFSYAPQLLLILAGLSLFISFILIISRFLIERYSYKYSTIFRIKVFDSRSGDKPWSTELIHSKIFVIDDETVFLGSANFTYSGFKKHYETVIRVEDKQAIKSISEEVETLYNSTIPRAKPIEEWARV